MPPSLPGSPSGGVDVVAELNASKESATPTSPTRPWSITPSCMVMDAVTCSSRPFSFDILGRTPASSFSSGLLLQLLSFNRWEEAPAGAGAQQDVVGALVGDQACSLDRPEQRWQRGRDTVPAAPNCRRSRARRAGLPMRARWSPFPPPRGGLARHGTTWRISDGRGATVRDAVREAGVDACHGSH